jgi:hypothetical protein
MQELGFPGSRYLEPASGKKETSLGPRPKPCGFRSAESFGLFFPGVQVSTPQDIGHKEEKNSLFYGFCTAEPFGLFFPGVQVSTPQVIGHKEEEDSLFCGFFLRNRSEERLGVPCRGDGGLVSLGHV